MVHPPSLPAEIIDEIFQYTSQSTLASLCLTSKVFKIAATRLLYHTLSLEKPSETVRCLKTLLRNTLAAKSCQTFFLEYFIEVIPQKAELFHAFFRLLSRALPTLINLRNISMSIAHYIPSGAKYAHSVDFVFQECTFPRLENMRISAPITPGLARFLERHQHSLTSASLCPVGFHRNPTFDHITYHFHKLNTLDINATAAMLFFASAPSTLPAIEYLTLDWSLFEYEYSQLITMVGERCTHEDLELSCNRRGWNFDLLTDIAAKIPRIADLSIDCSPLIEDPEDLTEDDFAQIAQILKKFQQLSDFSWTASCHYKGIEELDGKDAELHLTRVMSVAASCPSLRRCRILNSVYFHRFLENFWFPYKFGDDDPRMFQYMFDAVNQRKYPPLEELLHYIGYYTRLHGCIQEILKRFKEAETLDVANGGRKEATMDLLAIGQGLGFWPYPEFENHPVTKQLLQAREELSQVEIDGSMYT